MIKVGIPRALLYYQYFPMWKAFFEELGAEVEVSPPTTQAMMTSGSARVVADTCLPVKIFLGHVLALVDRCDYLFVPAIRSVRRKTYNCSKFLGLPDMTKAVIPESPPILDIDIDADKGKRALYEAIYKLGRRFTRNPGKVKRAGVAAWQAHLNYRKLMSDHGLTPPRAMEKIPGLSDLENSSPKTETAINSPQAPSVKATIALIGHPYVLYDEHINHRLAHRLEQAHNRVLTSEMLTAEELELAIIRLAGAPYWSYEEEVVGAGEHYLQSEADGVIGVMTFGCGPDSLMMDTVERRATKLKSTPFMSLTLDEHTAETGMVTRLEAFLDMIYRRKRKRAECV